jgi:hypothetical protein
MSKIHIRSIVSNTVTDSDIPDNPPYSKLDIPLRHQPPWEEKEPPPVPPTDHPKQDPKEKQVVLEETVSMQVILIHTHKGTLADTLGKVPSVSNPNFETVE